MTVDVEVPRPKQPPLRRAVYVEAAVAVLVCAALATRGEARALLAASARAVIEGLRATVALAQIDPGTVGPVLATVARALLLAAPVARAFALGPRQHLWWAPAVVAAFPVALGSSLPAISSPLMWSIFAAAGLAGWLAAARPGLRFGAFAAWAVLVQVHFSHGTVAPDIVWPPRRLEARCADNDGTRPQNLVRGTMGMAYYAVTPAAAGLMLLTGRRRSFWVRRDADGATTLTDSILPTANLWEGCVRDGAVWVTSTHVGGLCRVPIPNGDAPAEDGACFHVPGGPELGPEIDYVDAVCPRDRETVYFSQLLRGGYLEFDPRTAAATWHPVVPGLNLQMVQRADGRLVAITTSRLVVFDPASDRVVEEHWAGTVAMGVDVCAVDGSVAVADFAGRVRLFEIGEDGAYHYRAATSVPAARRVAFAPRCEQLLVTSGTDRDAYLIRRSGFDVVRRYRLGPALRDITFVDDTTAAVADACTVTLLDARP